MRSVLMTAAAVAAACLRLSAQEVTGTLVDASTEEPIEGAWVALLQDRRPVATELTDAHGAFSLRLPSRDRYHLRVDGIGYGTVTTPPLFRARSVGLEIRLHPRALKLSPIDVVGAPGPADPRGGFAERAERDRGGHFITRAQIDAQNVQHTSDLLRDVPGVQLEADPYGFGQRVQFGDDCTPAVVLDGARRTTGVTIDDLIGPSELLGIEVYRSRTGVPAELGMGGGCGVIALWSRR